MILVFKTNVVKNACLQKVKPVLDQLLPDARWNFGLDNCDKLLRINTQEDCRLALLPALNRLNFSCRELV
jgi:phage FluMu gp28-like protein